jgi:isocitrate/isopropylmalate dehydrogenase
MMLDHVEQTDRAERIRRAIRAVLAGGKIRTRDMGGTDGTEAYTDAVIRALG